MAEKLSAAERQKKAKAEAKELKRAQKEKRRTTTDPAEMGRIRQIVQAYKLTHEYDKALPWLMIGAFVLPIVIGVLIGLFAANSPVFGGLMGVAVGLILAMFVLVQRVKRATFARYEGELGSGQVALGMLDKKWVSQPAIAATKHKDVVHRAIGPGGIVLVGEGDPGRVRQLLAAEQRKHEKFTNDVLVTTYQIGDKDGQVPLNQLTNKIKKLPKALQPHQVTEVKSRMRAIDAVRPAAPMPKGPVPTSMKGARKGMRGR